MKIIFSLLLLTSSLTSWAGGFDCEAICISVNSSESTLYVLGEVNLVAGTSAKETHRLLKKRCQKLADQSGAYGSPMLIDSLDFSSSVNRESESSQSDSYGESGYGSVAASRRGFRVELGRELNMSSSRYYRQYEGRNLSVNLVPSNPQFACTADDSVVEGEIPYTGDLIIL